MKVAFLIDTLAKAGGGNNAILSECNLIKKISNKNIDVNFLTTSQQTKNFLEKNFPNSVLFFNKNSYINRIFYFLMQSEFLKFMIKRAKIKNILQKILLKNKIDLLIFLAPSDLIFFVENQNFIYTVWEFQHKNYPFLPEYKNIYFDVDVRDKTLKIASEKAFKIFVGTKKSKKDFSKYYSCDENKIIVRPLKTSMPDINITDGFNSKFISQLKEKKIKQYLFYPAQYWAHKNHKFIIDAFEKFSTQNKLDIDCIFAGSNKGNLNYIKDLINIKNLNNKIHVYEYLTDEEIVYLFKNCFAVVVPTLVGSISFPVIEGFFFKKPVICNVSNLDDEYKKYVFSLDIVNPQSLNNILNYIKTSPKEIEFKVLEAKTFFDELYDEQKLSNQYIEIVNEFNNYKKMWEH